MTVSGRARSWAAGSGRAMWPSTTSPSASSASRNGMRVIRSSAVTTVANGCARTTARAASRSPTSNSSLMRNASAERPLHRGRRVEGVVTRGTQRVEDLVRGAVGLRRGDEVVPARGVVHALEVLLELDRVHIHMRCLPTVFATAVVFVSGVTAARADFTVAPLDRPTPVSAYAGHVVFSRYDGSAFRLVETHASAAGQV